MEFPSGISRNQRKTIIFGTSSGGEEIETRAAGRDQLAISGTPRSRPTGRCTPYKIGWLDRRLRFLALGGGG